ncbi:hypothetical protein EUX98_g4507 [Antrodiella citrinella]|uniref:BTB domain-containing protein n=1 Tax=Antrodiella citrinella TaxID=2447956 RepID=A0A4S4MTT6_9APHY|nr:hypothetical protein EUX98_g4507 [Antrodiella citrinella]
MLSTSSSMFSMMSASEPESQARFTAATPPFDRPDGDIVLVSSDSVTFSCHKAILSMFSLPQVEPLSPSTTAVSSISVTENSKLLDGILRLIYPVVRPQMHCIGDVFDILRTGRKYQLSETVMSVPEAAFRELTSLQPLQSLVLSCRYDMEAEMYFSVRSVIWPDKFSEEVLTLVDREDGFEGLEHVTAGQYFRLLNAVRYAPVSSPFQIHPPPSQSDVDDRLPCEQDGSRKGWFQNCDLFDRIPADVHVYSTLLLDLVIPAHKFVLKFSSSILADYIAQSETDGTAEFTGITTIYLPEDGDTVHDLIRFCYGSWSSSSSTNDSNTHDINLATFPALVAAAQNYEMAKVYEVLQTTLTPFIRSDPVQTYFVAVACGWNDIALRAAQKSVRIPLRNKYVPQMEHCSGRTYQNLLDFRNQWIETAEKVSQYYHEHAVAHLSANRNTDEIEGLVSEIIARESTGCHKGSIPVNNIPKVPKIMAERLIVEKNLSMASVDTISKQLDRVLGVALAKVKLRFS